MALEYLHKLATDHANAFRKEVLQNLNYLAVHHTKQFEKLEMWAKMEELTRGRLERNIEEEKARNKTEMDILRRNMVTWKDQVEKMNATSGEAIQERRFFQAKAHRLEREALALGDEVRTVLKKGKTLSLGELKSVQKVRKRRQRLLSLPPRWTSLWKLQHHLPRHGRRHRSRHCRRRRNEPVNHRKHLTAPLE